MIAEGPPLPKVVKTPGLHFPRHAVGFPIYPALHERQKGIAAPRSKKSDLFHRSPLALGLHMVYIEDMNNDGLNPRAYMNLIGVPFADLTPVSLVPGEAITIGLDSSCPFDTTVAQVGTSGGFFANTSYRMFYRCDEGRTWARRKVVSL